MPRRRRARRSPAGRVWLVLVLAAALATGSVLAGVGREPAAPQEPPTAGSPVASPPPAVSSPPSRSPAPAPSPGGYRREAFGDGWADLDGDGCDTRAEVLARDLTDTTGDGHCTVSSGRLYERYTGRAATVRARDLDIDHVVALKDAWDSGAWAWTGRNRERFANDEGNLVATLAATNRSKGDAGPEEWLPVDRAGACWYVATYRQVKSSWGLILTPAQEQAVTQTLTGCPSGR